MHCLTYPSERAALQDPTSALFQLALGLTLSCEVDRLEFDPERHRLDTHISFGRGACFSCQKAITAVLLHMRSRIAVATISIDLASLTVEQRVRWEGIDGNLRTLP